MSAILIVDDSLTVRMHLSEVLDAAGFRTRPCASLAEARAALRTESIALAILDVRLPDGDGVELLRELRASPEHAQLPILMLSSEAEIADRIRGLRTGANDYIGKPFDATFVTARVRELVAPAAESTAPVVLVIDDSPTFRESLAASLAGAGYRPTTASSGAEGLRLAATQRPAAIIVDGVMPDMRGEIVIRRLRLDPALRATPCLLLTGSDDAAAEILALDAGADAFARKDAQIDAILARLAAMLRTAGAVAASESTSLLAPKRVLAVDDSPTYLHEIAEQLREDGYDVVQAGSGEAALELLAVQPVDCILLDLNMPGLSGIETCRRIKAVQSIRDIPLLALTAQEGEGTMIEMLAAGADDFVPKSTGREMLAARVKAQIRRKQFTDEQRRARERLLLGEREIAEANAARRLAETRAALADELARTNAELTAANRELEAFSYSVSHDLRAPLRAIRTFTQALQEEAGPRLDDTSRGHLTRVIAATHRMGDLIEAMLELARISRTGLMRSWVDLSSIAAAAIEELRVRDPQRRVEATVAPGLAASADPRLLRAVFDNLIGNAWKFSARRDPAHITVGTTGDAFFVKDDGAGFDMAYAAKLFRPFHRLHGGEFAGTGIGLATVHRIVERHNGRVWAESVIDAGTTVYFTLPGGGSGSPGS